MTDAEAAERAVAWLAQQLSRPLDLEVWRAGRVVVGRRCGLDDTRRVLGSRGLCADDLPAPSRGSRRPSCSRSENVYRALHDVGALYFDSWRQPGLLCPRGDTLHTHTVSVTVVISGALRGRAGQPRIRAHSRPHGTHIGMAQHGFSLGAFQPQLSGRAQTFLFGVALAKH
jgi:hypothetical protein